MDYYVTYDDENIYFLVRDIGGKASATNNMTRNNVTFKFGFNPNDYAQLATFDMAFGGAPSHVTDGIDDRQLKFIGLSAPGKGSGNLKSARDMATLGVNIYRNAYDAEKGREADE